MSRDFEKWKWKSGVKNDGKKVHINTNADGVWDADGPAEWSGKGGLTDGLVLSFFGIYNKMEIFRHFVSLYPGFLFRYCYFT